MTYDYENYDGSGKVTIIKDNETGLCTVSKFGNIKVVEDNGGPSVVRFKNGLEADITVDGDVELNGLVCGKITASGNIDTQKILDTSKCEVYPNTHLSSYDIKVVNGSIEFEGKVTHTDELPGGLFTEGNVYVNKYAEVTLNRNLSIVVYEHKYSFKRGFIFGGNKFVLAKGVKMLIHSPGDDYHRCDYGLTCNGEGADRLFRIEEGATLEICGVDEIGIDIYRHNAFEVLGGTVTIYSFGNGIRNRGIFYVGHGGVVNSNGIGNYGVGIVNEDEWANFTIDNSGVVNGFGSRYGILHDIASSAKTKNGILRGRFCVGVGGLLHAYGLGYMIDADGHRCKITSDCYSKEGLINVEGKLCIYCSGDKLDYDGNIKIAEGKNAKIYFNGLLVEGIRNPED